MVLKPVKKGCKLIGDYIFTHVLIDQTQNSATRGKELSVVLAAAKDNVSKSIIMFTASLI